ncbi:MAG: c-type cytochrome [Planctomycetota bacterium]
MKLAEYVSPEEFRRLLANLVVVLGAAGLFFVFGFMVVPGIRNANRPEVLPGPEPVVRETGWLDPVEFAPERARSVPPLDPKDVLEPAPALLEKGKSLYEEKCAACHGAEGRGDGPSARALRPPPRDFSKLEGWKFGPGRPAVYGVLSSGIPGSSMAAYDALRPAERMALVHRVRSFARAQLPPEEPAALERFANELAQAPARIPNRVPASFAIERLAAEAKVPPALELPPEDAGGPGAQALREAVWDPARAARALLVSGEWEGSEEAFARLVAAGLPGNGFATATLSFDPEKWRALRRELISRWRKRP